MYFILFLLFSVANAQCKDELCKECVNTYQDTACQTCKEPALEYPACTDCHNILMSTPDCSACKNGNSGQLCNQVPCTEEQVVGSFYPLNYYAYPTMFGDIYPTTPYHGTKTGVSRDECLTLIGTRTYQYTVREWSEISDTTLPYGCIESGDIIGFNKKGTGVCGISSNSAEVMCVQKTEENVLCYDDNTADLKKARYKERYQELNGCTLT